MKSLWLGGLALVLLGSACGGSGDEGKLCVNQNDCGGGLSCRSSVGAIKTCQRSTGGISVGTDDDCAVDADCGQNAYCETGLCVFGTGPVCSANADCESGFCDDRFCSDCVEDANCDAGQTCGDDGRCAQPQCTTDQECEIGENCFSGLCLADLGSPCNTTAECGRGERCDDFDTFTCVLVDPQCRSDGECLQSEFCNKGTCEPF